jgi:hypothetical protein
VTDLSFIHVQSMRLASGHEALVARVLTKDGKTGFGFSLRLDATEARHMAEWHAGARGEPPKIEPVLAHPWETAYIACEAIPWNVEPAFAAVKWLSS